MCVNITVPVHRSSQLCHTALKQSKTFSQHRICGVKTEVEITTRATPMSDGIAPLWQAASDTTMVYPWNLESVLGDSGAYDLQREETKGSDEDEKAKL